MAYDFEFTDGFDKYGPVGTGIGIGNFAGEWTSMSNGSTTVSIAASLMSSGSSLNFQRFNSVTFMSLSKTLPANYARVLGSVYLNVGDMVNHFPSVACGDGGSSQINWLVANSGQLQVYSNGTFLGQSALAVSAGTIICVAWDFTIHNTTGIVKLWINGVLQINLTGQNTRHGSSNNYVNNLALQLSASGSNGNCAWDHLWTAYYVASGGSDTPPLTTPIVETDYPTSDSSVQFTATAGVLGQDYGLFGGNNAPGANQVFLRRFTPLVNATINSVSCQPQATSAAAKFKAVIYADSAGVPNGAPLSSGVEVVGTTNGIVLTGALVTPQALTAGTPYWIGFITDTSVSLYEVDTTTTGGKAANTYTSGAPTTPVLTTGQPSWIIFGNCTGMAANWAQVTNTFNVPSPPAVAGDLSYNSDSVVGHEDLFGFPALGVGTSTVYTVAVKAWCERDGPGGRTVDMRTKSSGSDGAGSNAGQAPPVAYGWLSSYFDLDPNGSIAWTASAVNAATSGYKIAS
jgi:hypothetical protein